MYEFCSAALPWVSLGVLAAVFAAFSGGKLAHRPAKACMGFFGGIVFASLMGINPVYGMLFGMTAALLLSGKETSAEQDNNQA